MATPCANPTLERQGLMDRGMHSPTRCKTLATSEVQTTQFWFNGSQRVRTSPANISAVSKDLSCIRSGVHETVIIVNRVRDRDSIALDHVQRHGVPDVVEMFLSCASYPSGY